VKPNVNYDPDLIVTIDGKPRPDVIVLTVTTIERVRHGYSYMENEVFRSLHLITIRTMFNSTREGREGTYTLTFQIEDQKLRCMYYGLDNALNGIVTFVTSTGSIEYSTPAGNISIVLKNTALTSRIDSMMEIIC